MMIGRMHSGQGDPTSISPDGTDNASGKEAGVSPLASLVDVGVLEVELTDYAGPAPDAIVQSAALGDLLADALFGEVIDISDLIPQVLSSSADAATPGTSAAGTAGPTQPGLTDSGDILAAAGEAAVLTILYDDGLLASDGTIV